MPKVILNKKVVKTLKHFGVYDEFITQMKLQWVGRGDGYTQAEIDGLTAGQLVMYLINWRVDTVAGAHWWQSMYTRINSYEANAED